MWSILGIYVLVSFARHCVCVPVSNKFSENVRAYSVTEEDAIAINSTAKTLQQADFGRYAKFAPSTNPIKFKEVPDNALSESNYGRGLHHEHGGYGLHDFDETHYGYGFDYDHHDPGFNSHHVGYHGPHFGHGHHHHKHLNPHALAAKSILWPLAGLAILGTAAALVTNPVLLQLGVISGRRRRDTTEETGPDFNFNIWSKYENYEDYDETAINNGDTTDVQKPASKTGLKKQVHKDVKSKGLKAQSTNSETKPILHKDPDELEEKRYVPKAIR